MHCNIPTMRFHHVTLTLGFLLLLTFSCATCPPHIMVRTTKNELGWFKENDKNCSYVLQTLSIAGETYLDGFTLMSSNRTIPNTWSDGQRTALLSSNYQYWPGSTELGSFEDVQQIVTVMPVRDFVDAFPKMALVEPNTGAFLRGDNTVFVKYRGTYLDGGSRYFHMTAINSSTVPGWYMAFSMVSSGGIPIVALGSWTTSDYVLGKQVYSMGDLYSLLNITTPSGPTVQPPSTQPSNQPTRQPRDQPSEQPSSQPSLEPARQPSSQPSMLPSLPVSSSPIDSCACASNFSALKDTVNLQNDIIRLQNERINQLNATLIALFEQVLLSQPSEPPTPGRSRRPSKRPTKKPSKK